MWNYVVTAHKPTAITHSVVGHFTSPDETNLVLAKGTTMEIHKFSEEGLEPVMECPINGRISVLEFFSTNGIPHSKKKEAAKELKEQRSFLTDHLFVCTERYDFFVLDYEKGKLVTRVFGNLHDKIGRPCEIGTLGSIDPENRVIGMHFFDGILKMIPIDKKTGSFEDAFNLRIEELIVVDMKFLYSSGSSKSLRPTVAVLYQQKESRHVKTYDVHLREKDFREGSWVLNNVEGGTNMLIPVLSPYGGVFVCGNTSLTYFDGDKCYSIAINRKACVMKAYGVIDATRYLLGDHLGFLYILALQIDQSSNQVMGLNIEHLGETSSSSCISYLDNGFIFVGSCYGDSQVIKLNENQNQNQNQNQNININKKEKKKEKEKEKENEKESDENMNDVDVIMDENNNENETENNSKLSIHQTFTNLGPIVDFCIVDLQKQGQSQIVTCSGAWKDGSLRIIRSGIGICEEARIDMVGVRGVWTVGCENKEKEKERENENETDCQDMEMDNNNNNNSNKNEILPYYLVLSFVAETRILELSSDGEFAEAFLPGFVTNQSTILCESVVMETKPGKDKEKEGEGKAFFIQVTCNEVMLIELQSGKLMDSWKPLSKNKKKNSNHNHNQSGINLASLFENHLVLVFGDNTAIYLKVDLERMNFINLGQKEFANDISCLSINSYTPKPKSKSKSSEESEESLYIVVGMWKDFNICLFELPSFKFVWNQELGGEVTVRSAIFVTFEGIQYVLCGMGDGHLFTFVFDPQAEEVLSNWRKISLASQPIKLTSFKNDDDLPLVFAASDRPTVVHSSNHKLLYSNVNLKDVAHIARYSSPFFPGGLAIVSEDGLSICTIDEIQKLHIRTIPLQEMPRRICHQEDTHCFGVITVQIMYNNDTKTEEEIDWIKIFDEQNIDVLEKFRLGTYERGCSITSMSFSGESRCLFVVGTAFALPQDSEPNEGRILVFEYSSKRLRLIAEKETNGAVYVLSPFNGKLLAGINNKIQLYEWTTASSIDDSEKIKVKNNNNNKNLNGSDIENLISNTNTSSSSGGGSGSEFDDDSQKMLQPLCGHHGHILALYMAVRGDFIVVGDLMKSISLLVYNVSEQRIEELARDFSPNWMTAVEAFDDDTFIGAENSYNFFVCLKNSENSSDEERARLNVVGQYHVGEFVNRFRKGSLVMRFPESEMPILPTLVFGCVSGAIGLVANLPQDMFNFLKKVQNRIVKVIQPIGGIKHDVWRSFNNERRTEPAKNFIDGDIIESFLEMESSTQKIIVEDLEYSVDELVKKIESLQRALH